MLKCLAQLNPTELAEYLFRHRNQDIEFTFYAGYDEAAREPEYAYLARICNFAEARSLLINYMGGGNMFCYEFGEDSDPSGLAGLLGSYAIHNGFENGCWAQLPPQFRSTTEDTSEVPGETSNVIAIVESGFVTKAYANNERITLTIIDNDIDDDETKERNEEITRRLNEGLQNGSIFPIGIS